MRILLSWLKDFVEIREAPEDLAHALTMAGLAVDAIDKHGRETVFEFDITSNRPDAMNHFGMAREISVLYSRSLKLPEIKFAESEEKASSRATVVIEDQESCIRYVGRVFEDVHVKESPKWMQKRLELCGIRALNIMADLTNYVLLETGQPTHAFDLDTLSENSIVVRRARPEETLMTLDGELRSLSPEHLAICDAHKPVALAGVMGGAPTQITTTTRNVLLEAAWFRPALIRNTSRHFKLFTEASHRFERGADWDATTWATDRIATLLRQTQSGTVLRGHIDCYPKTRKLPSIKLEKDRIQRQLGVKVSDKEVLAILEHLGFKPVSCTKGWQMQAISQRLDVEREIDLIEEIARIYGYEKIPATLPATGAAPATTPFASEEAKLRSGVQALGYDETIGFAFISSSEAEQFGSSKAVKIRNPLSNQWDVMRNSAVPTMLRALEWNLNRKQPSIRLAEFGRLYKKSGQNYKEPRILTLGASGLQQPLSWHEVPKAVDFYDLKADLTCLLEFFDPGNLRFSKKKLPGYYKPESASCISAGRTVLAYFGEINPTILRARKIRQPVLIAEVMLDPLYQKGLRKPFHRNLPKVPSSSRDFSLLVPENLSFDEILSSLGRMPHLANIEPIEIFYGKNVPEGFYSLLLRATWQRLQESFTDEEIKAFANQLLGALQSKLNIRQRT